MGNPDKRPVFVAMLILIVIVIVAFFAMSHGSKQSQGTHGVDAVPVAVSEPASPEATSAGDHQEGAPTDETERPSHVKDAYNSVSSGMSEQAILEALGKPDSSGVTERPGVYGGDLTNVDKPNLPAGRTDTGETEQMVYKYRDGVLMIYLAGTADADHPQTGGTGNYYVCYRFWIIQ